jgi:hypothetical protein
VKSLSLCVVALVPLLAAGCGGRGSLPKTFPTTVEHWAGGTLDRVEFIHDFNISDYALVRIESVSPPAHVPDPDENTYAPVTKVLRDAEELFAAGIRSHVSRPPVQTASMTAAASAWATSSGKAGNVLVVRASVVEMDPGSASLRFWVNFGAGSAHTTMSGEVVDSASGRTLLRFERTEVDTGMSNLGLAGYESLLSGEVRETGKRVGKLLASFTPPG